MDSLLASYGSDDEDADSPPGSPGPAILKTAAAPAPSWNRGSLFGSLPPPHNSAPESTSSSLWDDEDEPVKPSIRSHVGSGSGAPAATFFTSLEPSLWDDEDEPVKRPNRIADRECDPAQAASSNSFFSSLPPPKIENGSVAPLEGTARAPRLEPVYDDTAAKGRRGDMPTALHTPKLEPATLPVGFFNSPSALTNRPSQKDDSTEGNPSSLFVRLPPPAPSKPLFAKLPPPSSSRPKVVKFMPPINYSLLETTEEDDLEQSRKRSRLEKSEGDRASEPKAGGGLMAFLPPPKNSLGSGAALGGGGGSHGGRRTVMETASDPYKMAREVTSGYIQPRVEKAESIAERPAMGPSQYGYGMEPGVPPSSVSYAQPDGGHYDPNLAQPLYAPSHFGSEGYAAGNDYFEQSLQYPDANAFGAGALPSQGQRSATGNVLAEVMKKERRKGRDEAPPQMMEVKQADLTGGSKLREDQMRSTGIAFGPTYKPVASNKDKPSKLHRRKHQIGALYFDMKQNEMNLLDRRAKGNLTKAETQAKYGW